MKIIKSALVVMTSNIDNLYKLLLNTVIYEVIICTSISTGRIRFS
jgi:hypothetical protein